LMNACNRILILKDGQLVGEVDPELSEEREIHPLMVGRELSADTYRVHDQRDFNGDEDPVLRVRNLSKKGLYNSVSLEVRRGEILGIGGLIGSGKKFLGETLFGVGEPTEGDIIIDGHPVSRATIRNMTKRRVGYVPSERKENGIIGLSTVADNLTITRFGEFSSRLGFINNRQEFKLIKEGIEKFRIKATSEDLCFSLSGGNQQKIVLTKWIMKNLDILILDNPTRGIDIGAKEEIYTFIREAANKNLAIILITDDLLELIGLSNRIVIMKDGNISLIVDADKRRKPTEQELVRDMV
ncbi:MAG: ATP-binding cassette domain-containing protein, partial [Mesotoga sp.]